MIALIRSAISDRSRHAFPVEPRVVGVAGLLCVPGTGLWGWSDSSRRWYTRHSRVTADRCRGSYCLSQGLGLGDGVTAAAGGTHTS